MKLDLNYQAMLDVALVEARKGLAEGGIPIGAAIFDCSGRLVGAGHNRRVQDGDPSMHAETNAFRNAGRQRSYRDLVMVTTLAPCWYCSGLVRQFGFGALVAGESRNFQGGLEWLRSLGLLVVDLDSRSARRCWPAISMPSLKSGMKTSEKSKAVRRRLCAHTHHRCPSSHRAIMPRSRLNQNCRLSDICICRGLPIVLVTCPTPLGQL